MKSCFVVGNATFNDGNTGTTLAGLNDLANGAIGIFNANTGAEVAASSDLTDDQIIIAMGRTGLPPQRSILINREDIDYSSPTTAASAVAKVMCLGNTTGGSYNALAIPSTYVEGAYVEVIIVDKTKTPEDFTAKKRYTYAYKSTEDIEDVIDAIVALINADENAIVTATALNSPKDGISLTGVAGNDFAASLSGDWADYDIIEYKKLNGVYNSVVTSGVRSIAYGVGTADQVRAIEEECFVEDGNTDTASPVNGLHNFNTRAVTGTLYNIYILQYKNARRNGGRTNVPADTQIIYICVPATAPTYNALNAIMADVLPAL